MRSDPRATQRLGSVIGERYQIEQVIGEGGAAVVYAARDLRLGNQVALKVALVRNPLLELRMEREARVAANLHHPNACLVTDLGRLDDGAPYLVMELLLGMSLADRLRQAPDRRLDVAETVELAEQVLSVLSVAHEQGVVHRDIKPENLFLARVPGRPALVKVLDFGAATSDVEVGLTTRGNTVGTPSYMSPEQAAGEPDIDGRSDIYACAAVLFECLTGRRTFEGATSNELLAKIASHNAPRVATFRSDVPPWIAQAIDRALDVARDARFPTALDFLEALGAAGQHTYDAWDVSTASLGDVPADERFEDETERIPPR